MSLSPALLFFGLAFFGLAAAFVRGFVTGVAVSVPTGPVNVAVIRNGISISVKMGTMVGLGAAVIDALYSLLAYLGLVPLITRVPWVEPVLATIGCVILIVYGATCIWRPVYHPASAQRAQEAWGRAVALGSVMTLANPAPLLAWVGIAGATMVGLTVFQAVIFAFGVLGGGAAWFVILATLAHKGTVKSGARATWVTRIVGILLIGFGIYLGVRAYVKTTVLL